MRLYDAFVQTGRSRGSFKITKSRIQLILLFNGNMMKNINLLLILFICCAISIQAQENIQRKQLFDNDWKFYLGDLPKADINDFDDKTWRSLDLPHDWSIEGIIDQKNPTGGAGGYFPAGIGWYRKQFSVSSTWKDKLVSIFFEGVYMNSEVFINGKSLGVHPYGYTSFSYDLTPYLDFSKKNILSVRVDNSKQPTAAGIVVQEFIGIPG